MPKNQCDGCQAGLPLENGMHIDGAPGGKFVCTKGQYKKPLSTIERMNAFGEIWFKMSDMDKFCLAMYLGIGKSWNDTGKFGFQQFRLGFYIAKGGTPSYMGDLDDILVFERPVDEV